MYAVISASPITDHASLSVGDTLGFKMFLIQIFQKKIVVHIMPAATK